MKTKTQKRLLKAGILLLLLGAAGGDVGATLTVDSINDKYGASSHKFISGAVDYGFVATTEPNGGGSEKSQQVFTPNSNAFGFQNYLWCSVDITTYDVTSSTYKAVAGNSAFGTQNRIYNNFNSTTFGYDNRITASTIVTTNDGKDNYGENNALGSKNRITNVKGANAIGSSNSATKNYTNAIGYSNTASGVYGIAVGYRTTSGGTNAVALGNQSSASNTGSVAIGYMTLAKGEYSISIGGRKVSETEEEESAIKDQNTAQGSQSIAIGLSNLAKGQSAQAIGSSNDVNGTSSIAYGSGNYTQSNAAQAIGFENKVHGKYSIAYGKENLAYGSTIDEAQDSTIAIGTENQARRESAIAIGSYNLSTGWGSLAIGGKLTTSTIKNLAQNDASLAIGLSNQSTANYAVSIGTLNTASGEYAITVGYQNTASTDRATAIGYSNTAQTGTDAVAIGTSNTAKAREAVAIGSNNIAEGIRSLAIGGKAVEAQGVNSVENEAKAAGSMALGLSNIAYGSYSVAVGTGNETGSSTSSEDYGWKAVALGFLNKAQTDGSIAIGSNNTSSKMYAIAMGYQNTAEGQQSVSIGYQTQAQGKNSISIGGRNVTEGETTVTDQNIAGSEQSIAIGLSNKSTGVSAQTIGSSNVVNGKNAIAYGSANKVYGFSKDVAVNDAIAVGSENEVYTTNSVAVGYKNEVTQAIGYSSAIAMGAYNQASGASAISIGTGVSSDSMQKAIGNFAIALGNAQTAEGEAAIAVGNANTASENSSFAIGSSNTASAENALALGGSNETAAYASMAFGLENFVYGDGKTDKNSSIQGSMAQGMNNKVYGMNAIAMGARNQIGKIETSDGNFDTASSVASDVTLAFGVDNTAEIGKTSLGDLADYARKAKVVSDGDIQILAYAIASKSADPDKAIKEITNDDGTLKSADVLVEVAKTLANGTDEQKELVTWSGHGMLIGEENTVYGAKSLGFGVQNTVNSIGSVVLGGSNTVGKKATNDNERDFLSMAIGSYNTIQGSLNVTMGIGSTTYGSQTISIGQNTIGATGNTVETGIGLGIGNTISSDSSVAIGGNNIVSARAELPSDTDKDGNKLKGYALAFGVKNKNYASASMALGGENELGTETGTGRMNSIVMGIKNTVDASNALGLGVANTANVKDVTLSDYTNLSEIINSYNWSTTSKGTLVSNGVLSGGAMMIGQSNTVDAPLGLGFGTENKVSAIGSIALGGNNTVGNTAATDTTRDYLSMAIGSGNKVTGSLNVSMGIKNDTTASQTISIGGSNTIGTADSSLEKTVVLGIDNTVQSSNALAIGQNIKIAVPATTNAANAVNAVSLTADAVGSGKEVAMGTDITIAENAGQSTAIGGANTIASSNSVALGYKSVVVEDQENVVSVGYQNNDDVLLRRVVNVADGVQPQDAATYRQIAELDQTLTFNGKTTTQTIDTNGGDTVATINLQIADTIQNGDEGFASSSTIFNFFKDEVGFSIVDYDKKYEANGNYWLSTDFDSNIPDTAKGADSAAYGYGAHAKGDNSVALGSHSTAANANEVSFGHTATDIDPTTITEANPDGTAYETALTRKLTNVSDGEANSDAATVGQLLGSGTYDADKGTITFKNNENGDAFTVTGIKGASPSDILDSTKPQTVTLANTTVPKEGEKDTRTNVIRAKDGTTVLATFEKGDVAGTSTGFVSGGDVYAAIAAKNQTVSGENITEPATGEKDTRTNVIRDNAGNVLVTIATADPDTTPTDADKESGNKYITEKYFYKNMSTVIEENTIVDFDENYEKSKDHYLSTDFGKEKTTTHGKDSTAYGYGANAQADNSVALGSNSIATSSNEVSFGNDNLQRKLTHVAAGTVNTDAANYGQLVDAKETADGKDNTVYKPNENGVVTVNTNDGNVAFKIKVTGSSDNSDTIVNYNPKYSETAADSGKRWLSTDFDLDIAEKDKGNDSAAYGYGAKAQGDNSVAIGSGSIAKEDYTFSVGDGTTTGNRRIVNVSDGTEDTDAATVGQLLGSGTYNSADGSITFKNKKGDAAFTVTGIDAGIEYTGSDNITVDNKTHTISAKTTDTIAKDDKGLVTSETMYKEDREAITKAEKTYNIKDQSVGDNLVALDNALKDTEDLSVEEGQTIYATTEKREGDSKKQQNIIYSKNGTALAEMSVGEIADGNTGFVSGDSVYDAIASKNQTLSGSAPTLLSNDGKTQIATIKTYDSMKKEYDPDDPTTENQGDAYVTYDGMKASVRNFAKGIVDYDETYEKSGDHRLSTDFGKEETTTHGKDSTAYGYGANAQADNSVALGSNSIATSSNEVSFGNDNLQRTLTHVADGTVNTDAATYGQIVNAQLQKDGSYTAYKANADGIISVTNNEGGVAFKLDVSDLGGSGKIYKGSDTITVDNDNNTISAKTTDKIAKDDKGLVTSETMYKEDREAITKAETNHISDQSVGDNLVALDKAIGKVADGSPTNKDPNKNTYHVISSDNDISKNLEAIDGALKDTSNLSVATGQTIYATTAKREGDSKKQQNIIYSKNGTALAEMSVGEIAKENTGFVSGGTVYDAIAAKDQTLSGDKPYLRANDGTILATLKVAEIPSDYVIPEIPDNPDDMPDGGDVITKNYYYYTLKKYFEKNSIVDFDEDYEKSGNHYLSTDFGKEKDTTHGKDSTAYGYGANATGNDSVALGKDAKSEGNGSVAIGKEAKAQVANSVALGSGSVATEAMTVSVGDGTTTGNRRIVNVAYGKTNSDAATYGQIAEANQMIYASTAVRSADSDKKQNVIYANDGSALATLQIGSVSPDSDGFVSGKQVYSSLVRNDTYKVTYEYDPNYPNDLDKAVGTVTVQTNEKDEDGKYKTAFTITGIKTKITKDDIDDDDDDGYTPYTGSDTIDVSDKHVISAKTTKKITEGGKELVTSDTMYKEDREAIKKASTTNHISDQSVGDNLVALDKAIGKVSAGSPTNTDPNKTTYSTINSEDSISENLEAIDKALGKTEGLIKLSADEKTILVGSGDNAQYATSVSFADKDGDARTLTDVAAGTKTTDAVNYGQILKNATYDASSGTVTLKDNNGKDAITINNIGGSGATYEGSDTINVDNKTHTISAKTTDKIAKDDKGLVTSETIYDAIGEVTPGSPDNTDPNKKKYQAISSDNNISKNLEAIDGALKDVDNLSVAKGQKIYATTAKRDGDSSKQKNIIYSNDGTALAEMSVGKVEDKNDGFVSGGDVYAAIAAKGQTLSGDQPYLKANDGTILATLKIAKLSDDSDTPVDPDDEDKPDSHDGDIITKKYYEKTINQYFEENTIVDFDKDYAKNGDHYLSTDFDKKFDKKGKDSTAYGYGANAQGDNSVAIGSGSVATEANTFSVGAKDNERKIVNVAAGTKTTDAVNFGQIAQHDQHLNINPSKNTEFLYDENGDLIAEITVQLPAYPGYSIVDYSTNEHWLATDFDITGVKHGEESTAFGYKAEAAGERATAVGYGNKAESNHDTAVGYANEATGGHSTAVGDENKTTGEKSAAYGYHNEASGEKSTALGAYSKAEGNSSVALGDGAEAKADNSMAFGSGSVATEEKTVSFGKADENDPSKYEEGSGYRLSNIEDGKYAHDAATKGQLDSAIKDIYDDIGNRTKYFTYDEDQPALIIGDPDKNKAEGKNTTSMGFETEAKGEGATAIGDNSKATGDHSTALGYNSKANSNHATALGDRNDITGEYSTGVGAKNTVDGQHSIAAGCDNTVTGEYSGAFGHSNTIKGNNSYAFGGNSTVEGDSSIAIGDGATAKGDKAIAFGPGATAAEGSVAIGPNSVATDKDEVSFGNDDTNRRLTHVADGTGDHDAATVGQVNKVGDRVTEVEKKVDGYDSRISGVEDSMGKGIAGASALAALHPLEFDPDDKASFAVGYGHFKSSDALALGAFYRPNESVLFSFGGVLGNGEDQFNAGISFALGRDDERTHPLGRIEMSRRIQTLQEENAGLTDRVDRLERFIAQMIANGNQQEAQPIPTV